MIKISLVLMFQLAITKKYSPMSTMMRNLLLNFWINKMSQMRNQ